MSEINLLVIRHGESEWNALGRWQGQADPPLTERGQQQALTAAMHITGSFDLVVSSDLQRAHHTARIIADHLELHPVVTESRLRERHAGPWQGLTRSEIEEQWPGALASRTYPPGYESDDLVIDRVLPALRSIADRVEGSAVVVAHMGIIRAIDRATGGIDERIPNLGGRWYRVGSCIEPGELVELTTAKPATDVE